MTNGHLTFLTYYVLFYRQFSVNWNWNYSRKACQNSLEMIYVD